MQEKTRQRVYRWGGVLAALIILLAVLVALLPLAVKWWLTGWLEEQGLGVEIEQVDISLWNGEFALRNLEVTDSGQQSLRVGDLRILISPGDLFNKTVAIRDVSLDEAFVRISEGAQGVLRVGGVALGTGEAQQADAAPAAAWGIRVEGVNLDQVEVCYALGARAEAPPADGCARLQRLRWQGMLEYTPTLKQDQVHHLLQGDIDLVLEDFETSTEAGASIAFSFSGLRLNNVDIDDVGQVSLGEVRFTAPSGALTRRGENGRALSQSAFQTKSLRLQDIRLDQARRVSIAAVVVEDYSAQHQVHSDSGKPLIDMSHAAQSLKVDNIARLGGEKSSVGTISIMAPSVRMNSLNDNGTAQSRSESRLKQLQISGIDVDNDKGQVDVEQLALRQYTGDLELYAGGARKPKKTYKAEIAALELKGFSYAGGMQYAARRLDVETISVSDEGEGDTPIARLNAMAVSEFSMDGLDSIRVAGISLDQLGMFFNGEKPADISAVDYRQYLNSASVSNLQLRERNHLKLDDAVLGGLHMTLVRGEDGRLKFERPIAELLEDPPAGEAQPAEQGEPVRVQAARLRLDGDSQIRLIDRSFEPVVERRIHKIDITMNDVDTADSDTLSPFSLSMLIGEHGTIAAQGKGALFTARPSVQAKGTVRGVDLAKFSAYAEQVIQHQIQSGHLEADLNIKIQQGQLDSLADLTLHKFYLDATPKKNTQYEKELGMPLSTALSLLREKDDSIHIKLPVSGDITAPDFSLKHVVRDVMGDAIKSAIISYYTPFGVVTIAGAAFDFLTALRFKPVKFEPGQALLDGEDRTALAKIADMLQQRENVRLVVCGKAVLEDRIELFDIDSEQAEQMRALLKGGADPAELSKLPELTEAQRTQLNALARERTTVVKNYLRQEGGIAPERLIECNPQYEPEDSGAPRTVLGV